MARRNAELDAVVSELETAEVDYRIREGKRHVLVSWTKNGKREQVAVSRTASDRRAQLNARCEVRRKLGGLING